MKNLASYRRIDLSVVAIANLLNLIMVPISILRTMKVEHPQVVGLVWVVFILILASIMGMIGYSFAEQKKYGFITLATYFLSQIAALYSYFKVGHG